MSGFSALVPGILQRSNYFLSTTCDQLIPLLDANISGSWPEDRDKRATEIGSGIFNNVLYYGTIWRVLKKIIRKIFAKLILMGMNKTVRKIVLLLKEICYFIFRINSAE